MDYENKIDIPFGAKDSELKGWEYTIPEGMEAIIKDGKVIVREKDSEDERIRRELIGYAELKLKYFTEANSKNDIDKKNQKWWKDVLAYLEKQKEQKPDKCNGCNNVKGCINCVDGDQWAHIEEVPANGGSEKPNNQWSEEDERNFYWISTTIQERHLTPEYTQKVHKILSWLKSLRPQPNTVSVENAIKFGNLEYERGVKDGIQHSENHRWKPSEEQMYALEEALAYVNANMDCYEPLISLYNDLKKL